MIYALIFVIIILFIVLLIIRSKSIESDTTLLRKIQDLQERLKFQDIKLRAYILSQERIASNKPGDAKSDWEQAEKEYWKKIIEQKQEKLWRKNLHDCIFYD